MADLSQAVTNTVGFYGIDQNDIGNPSLWGVLVWGVDLWGFPVSPVLVRVASVYTDTETPTDSIARVDANSVYTESESPSDDEFFSVESLYTESESPSDLPCVHVDTSYGESESPESGNGAERLQDGNGYFYVFPYPSTNAENRPTNSFTCGVAAGGTWTSGAAGSTVWSE